MAVPPVVAAVAQVQGQVRSSRQEIVDFGGINDPEVSKLRSSDRIRAQPNADASAMERAMLLAQRHGDPSTSGTKPKPSLLTLPNEVIITRASRLGVSLGESPSQVFESVNYIKEIEHAREVIFLKNNMDNLGNGDDQNMIIKRATNLSEDLVNEEGQEAEEEACLDHMDLFPKNMRGSHKNASKMGNGLSVRRRSARIEKLNKRTK